MKKIALLLAVIMLLGGGTAFAGDPVTKFFRGVTNIITSPVEYWTAYAKFAAQNDPFAVIFGGTIYGTIQTGQRILAGVYEVATFPLPLPRDYRPILEPENAIQEFNALQ